MFFAPPRSPTRPGASPESCEPRGAGAEGKRLPAPRAGRARDLLWWVVSQGGGSGRRQAAFLRGTKVELTPSAAGRAPAAWSSPRSKPGSRPGPRVGEGVSAAAPPPAAREDLLIRPPHRAAAGQPLTSAPRRLPLLPPRPPLNTAETTASQRHLKYRIKNPETLDSLPHNLKSPPPPRRQSPPSPPVTPPRDRARPAPAAAARPRTRSRDSGAVGAPIPAAPLHACPLFGREAGAIRPIPSRRGERARSLVRSAAPEGPAARAVARLKWKTRSVSGFQALGNCFWLELTGQVM